MSLEKRDLLSKSTTVFFHKLNFSPQSPSKLFVDGGLHSRLKTHES